MPVLDQEAMELLQGAQGFLQWDLVTVTPWGAPVISPVGARVIAKEATLWTSTTVGYASKVRNIASEPKVALLRSAPGERPLLIQGEARVVRGDGTRNLTEIFRLMGGAGGTRRFFARSTRDPFWAWLYRSYWRRYLIRVRVVTVATLGASGWQERQVGRWSLTADPAPPPPRRGRRQPLQRFLDGRGRAMLAAGTGAVLATVPERGGCPSAWPITASPLQDGAISIRSEAPLPEGLQRHSTVAVRVVDDAFEVAEMVAWIGSLEPGRGSHRLVPRSVYGFAKPPGLLGDLGAGVAAVVSAAVSGHDSGVSAPDVSRAARLAGGGPAPEPELDRDGWALLEQFFARRNAATVWYSGLATLSVDRDRGQELALLAERAAEERDWAQALLIRGGRRVGPARLLTGALSLRPDPSRAWARVQREEREADAIRGRLHGLLPAGGKAPPLAPGAAPDEDGAGLSPGRGGLLASASAQVARALAAGLDRLAERGRA